MKKISNCWEKIINRRYQVDPSYKVTRFARNMPRGGKFACMYVSGFIHMVKGVKFYKTRFDI